MNVKLLRRIQRMIKRRPLQFNMDSWFGTKETFLDEPDIPACGTTGCIAGWAITLDLTGKHKKAEPKKAAYFMETRNNYQARASQLLDVPIYIGKRLYFIEGWPLDLRQAYHAARKQALSENNNPYDNKVVAQVPKEIRQKVFERTTFLKNQVVLKAIDRFIETNGFETTGISGI